MTIQTIKGVKRVGKYQMLVFSYLNPTEQPQSSSHFYSLLLSGQKHKAFLTEGCQILAFYTLYSNQVLDLWLFSLFICLFFVVFLLMLISGFILKVELLFRIAWIAQNVTVEKAQRELQIR